MRTLSIFLVAILVLTAGCSRTDRSNDLLTVATDGTYQPFEYYDENHELIGFDIDLMRALAEEAQFRITFKNQPFDGLVAGLETGKYDAAISAMTITEERAKRVLFTDPYYDAGQIIAVRSDQIGIERLQDLEGKKIGAQRGTTGAIEARKVPNAEVIEYDTIDLAFLALKGGKVIAVLNDGPTSQSIAASREGFKLVGAPLTEEKYGIALPRESVELVRKLNAALATLKQNGTYEQLQRKWFGSQ